MFAVIKTGGKQYSVESGKKLKVEKIIGKSGDKCSFDKVLIIGDSSNQTIGTPFIKGAAVEATIVDQILDNKVIVFKKRRRKNYRSTQGHRQKLTIIKIDKILIKSTKIEKKAQPKSAIVKEKKLEKTQKKSTKSNISNKKTTKTAVKKKTIAKKSASKKKTIKKK